jgi:hypothetical protein
VCGACMQGHRLEVAAGAQLLTGVSKVYMHGYVSCSAPVPTAGEMWGRVAVPMHVPSAHVLRIAEVGEGSSAHVPAVHVLRVAEGSGHV